MSVFFDHRAGTNTNSVHTDIQWHPTFALLAVATKIDDADNEAQGAVSLFFDEVTYFLCVITVTLIFPLIYTLNITSENYEL